ncbi:MAG: TetR/AcrR family transcriptional regulator [Rhodoluna sp.]|nr:TetR/AcrR family transcriptional regulator [Rhodoluna sp.]
MARPRGNYAMTAVRRESILNAALEIFGKSGYNGSSVKQVALAVGMTEAGVLHHFGTKSNLLIEVLRVRDDATTKFLPTASTNPLDFVSGWLNLMAFNVSQPGIVDLFTKLAAESTDVDHPAHAYFKERYVFVSKFCEEYFDRLSASGYMTSGADSRTLSIALVALADGLQLQWLHDRNVDICAELSSFFQSVLSQAAWLEVEFDDSYVSA